ncbi:MAG: hypothetical protein PHC54_05485 [Candidatus Omnitrophica bacterium]|nr:hypothetical protein [Candidatus Omnitrophota bacterium]MDD5592647.1 hypothetical protein [Candidatus Omnitrophota bacterium]
MKKRRNNQESFLGDFRRAIVIREARAMGIPQNKKIGSIIRRNMTLKMFKLLFSQYIFVASIKILISPPIKIIKQIININIVRLVQIIKNFFIALSFVKRITYSRGIVNA